MRIRENTPLSSELSLPPAYTLVRLRELGDAYKHALDVADEMGAGTLVYVGRFDLAEFAVVLEPEEPLRSARRAFYAGMGALADALAAHAPPEKPMDIVWPDAVRVDLGLVGGGRLGWPKGAKEDEVPRWLVFGGMVRVVGLGDEPGVKPLSTALEEEGFTDFAAGQLVESFSRHFMTIMDAWQERGFDGVARDYLARIRPESGVRRGIDVNGDLLIRGPGKTDSARMSLVEALKKPSWYDPKASGPKR